MMMARFKNAGNAAAFAGKVSAGRKNRNAKPTLAEFIAKRDFVGAATLLDFNLATGEDVDDTTPLWRAYTAFHLGDYRKAYEVYREVLAKKKKKPDPNVFLYASCCLFYLGWYQQAEQTALQGPTCGLKHRLLFQSAQRMGNEEKVLQYHARLQDELHDQLCLASIHYARRHYHEAIEIYKRFLLEHREFHALNVYIALCYYKMDYTDVAAEVLTAYLTAHPDSMIAVNLKACNTYCLGNGRNAEEEMRPLIDAVSNATHSYGVDLVKHNLVVFRRGENALQVLPPLVGSIPEARLNLVIHYLRTGDITEAYALMKDQETLAPKEYVLKGIVNCEVGQRDNNREAIKLAQQYFQVIGSLPDECDTIQGRQCMASCFFLLKQFADVLVYLNSIQTYMANDSAFAHNLGIALAATGKWAEAEEALLGVEDERLRSTVPYLTWLARCFVMNGNPGGAWELYLKMESSQESIILLQSLAKDCYKHGEFFYAAKAFDVLERVDPNNPEYWEGKRGAAVGVFQQVVAMEESPETLREIICDLANTNNPQVDYLIRVFKKWGKEHGFKF